MVAFGCDCRRPSTKTCHPAELLPASWRRSAASVAASAVSVAHRLLKSVSWVVVFRSFWCTSHVSTLGLLSPAARRGRPCLRDPIRLADHKVMHQMRPGLVILLQTVADRLLGFELQDGLAAPHDYRVAGHACRQALLAPPAVLLPRWPSYTHCPGRPAGARAPPAPSMLRKRGGLRLPG